MIGPLKAQCRCGQLSASCEGEPTRISICHCHACQLRTGSVFAAQMRFPIERVTISGESQRWVRTADSGAKVNYNFCPGCGSTVFYEGELFPGVLAIPMGAFAGIDLPQPRFSVYEERKVPWIELIGEDIEHHD